MLDKFAVSSVSQSDTLLACHLKFKNRSPQKIFYTQSIFHIIAHIVTAEEHQLVSKQA